MILGQDQQYGVGLVWAWDYAAAAGTGGKLCFGVTAHPALLGEATSYAALQGKIAAHATLKGEVRANPC